MMCVLKNNDSLSFYFQFFLLQLNLKKCENTYIGDAEKSVKGISTGEKRRLAVATEVIGVA
jgi:hypothetical protein